MLRNPATKYRAFKPLDLPARKWPGKVITKPPRWLSTDLRDGNQSLVDPMTVDEKLMYFDMLVRMGFKEIEVSFPSASQPDFDLVRRLIEEPNRCPDDVALQVLSPCRSELIQRTVESLRGSKNAIVHIYNATSPLFRRVVFNKSPAQTIDLAVKSTKLVRSLTKDSEDPEMRATRWQFEYSPETFSATEPEFAVEICAAVKEAWGPSVDNPIIFNLPATVEVSYPTVYADQVEYFLSNMPGNRDEICVSLHPHNDRGTAVAAAELGQMAGADRVEGCLFANGERTGNVDLVTLALNMYTQGINPQLDFSNIQHIINTCETCNKIGVHPRHPYAGDLVFTAFSGSHQDAIKKGFADREQRTDGIWEIPYLPVDPKDLGASYEAVIRVNSQSGKGGVAWVVQQNLHLDMPRTMQVSFAKVVQALAEERGRELLSNEITRKFNDEYGISPGSQYFTLDEYMVKEANGVREFSGKLTVTHTGETVHLSGKGNGPLSSLLDALKAYTGRQFDVAEYHEHAIGSGRDTQAASYVKLVDVEEQENAKVNRLVDRIGQGMWGVAIDSDVTAAGLRAVLSSAGRYLRIQK